MITAAPFPAAAAATASKLTFTTAVTGVCLRTPQKSLSSYVADTLHSVSTQVGACRTLLTTSFATNANATVSGIDRALS